MNSQLDSDLVLHALGRVRKSREFRPSPGLQNLLTYLVESSLREDDGALKESIIGVEVFHRAPGYDTKADPIVRVQANRLRGKLERYYAKEGVQDLIGISLPSGAYVPVIERRAFDHKPVAGSSPAKPTRLLVLPLTNLAGGREREFFSDGLTEELIQRLSCSPGLQVLARTTAMALRGKSHDIARLRERFAVDVVIEGSVRQTQNQVNVSLRLVAAKDGVCIWSGQFERRLEHATQLADDVSATVARELKLRVAEARPAAVSALAPAVHEAQLLGRYFFNRWRPEQSPDPAAYFRRAIQLDPTFAPAYCGLADCLHLQAFWAQAHPRDVMPEAVAAVERALGLDPKLADAHCSLGTFRNAFDWDSEACRVSLARCLELDPGHATGRREYAAAYLTPLGQLDEARGWLMEARELDPLSPLIQFHLAQNAWFAGHHELALANAAHAVELDRQFTPAHWILALVATDLGRWEQAEASLTQAKTASLPIYSGAVEAWVLAAQGRREEARWLVQELLALRTREYCSDACLAFALLGLGQRQPALQLIVEAIKARDPHLRLIGVAPVWRGMYEEPAWPQLLEQVRLPAPIQSEGRRKSGALPN